MLQGVHVAQSTPPQGYHSTTPLLSEIALGVMYPVLQILTKLMSTCITFSKHIDKVYKELEVGGQSHPLGSRFADIQEQLQLGTDHARKVLDSKGHQGTITKLEKTFNTHLQYLIKALKTFGVSEADPYLTNLSSRIDYNSFYERHCSDEPLTDKK